MRTFNPLYLLIATIIALVIGGTFTGCQPEPVTSQRLPVEQNFEPEKIWTENDFKQAEVEPLDVSYTIPCQTACPDNITADDLALINQHHQKQMQRLTEGANK
ncbi:hypothetical protein ACWIUH_05620 [Ursidibacter arcticus]